MDLVCDWEYSRERGEMRGGGGGERERDAGGDGENGAKPKLMAADGEYIGTGGVPRGRQVA